MDIWLMASALDSVGVHSPSGHLYLDLTCVRLQGECWVLATVMHSLAVSTKLTAAGSRRRAALDELPA